MSKKSIQCDFHVATPHIFAPLFTGWLFSRIVLNLVRGAEIGAFVILPGFMFGLFYIWWFYRNQKSGIVNQNFALFLWGIILDSLAFCLVRMGSGSIHETSALWGPLIAVLSLGFLSAGLAIAWIISRFPSRKTLGERHLSNNSNHIWFGIGLFGAILVFRISGQILIDLPNEERSMMVLGTEVHHAFQGFLVLYIFHLLSMFRIIQKKNPYFLITGFFVGFIADQVTYLSIKDCSDMAYYSNLSLWGAIVVSSIFLFFLFYRRQPAKVDKRALEKVLTHRLRGFSEFEHTGEGFRRAIKSECPFIEVDVRVGKDKELWIYHNSATAGDVIRSVNFKSGTNNQILGTCYRNGSKILKLSDALLMFKDHGAQNQILCLDVKDFGFEEEILQLIRQYEIEDRIYIVSWMPQSLTRFYDLGCRSRLIFSHLNLMRFGRLGAWFVNATAKWRFSLGRVVFLGKEHGETSLGKYSWGYQHGFFCQELPKGILTTMTASGGGICVPTSMFCEEIQDYVRETGLILMVFSVKTRKDFLKFANNSSIDAVFCDDAPLLLDSGSQTSDFVS